MEKYRIDITFDIVEKPTIAIVGKFTNPVTHEEESMIIACKHPLDQDKKFSFERLYTEFLQRISDKEELKLQLISKIRKAIIRSMRKLTKEDEIESIRDLLKNHNITVEIDTTDITESTDVIYFKKKTLLRQLGHLLVANNPLSIDDEITHQDYGLRITLYKSKELIKVFSDDSNAKIAEYYFGSDKLRWIGSNSAIEMLENIVNKYKNT